MTDGGSSASELLQASINPAGSAIHARNRSDQHPSLVEASMSERKPVPILSSGKSKTCPVCGKNSYSRAGIHPQCAAKQADAARSKLIKEKRKRDATARDTSSWNQKTCPECNTISHVRLKRCQCGHVISDRLPAAKKSNLP
jgi:hypothetical protein